jgi:membrane-bound lytic murein transglycosylase MltF
VRERLPLLAQQRWYTRARRGYARGWEPVQFVDRIQRFLTLLEWQPGESGPAPAAAAAAAAATAPAPATPSQAPAGHAAPPAAPPAAPAAAPRAATPGA